MLSLQESRSLLQVLCLSKKNYGILKGTRHLETTLGTFPAQLRNYQNKLLYLSAVKAESATAFLLCQTIFSLKQVLHNRSKQKSLDSS